MGERELENCEIERKFLIDGFPDHLPLLEESVVWQGYISHDPVVRIRKKLCNGAESYRLCFKSKGTLVRREIEMDITGKQFLDLSELLSAPPIRKDFRVYALSDGKRLECSLVDGDLPIAFYYAEIEFSSVTEAKIYEPPLFLGEEKTEDPAFTMSRYWERRKEYFEEK